MKAEPTLHIVSAINNAYVLCIMFLTLKNGASPLSAACLEGHAHVVEVLIKGGADINEVSTKVGI